MPPHDVDLRPPQILICRINGVEVRSSSDTQTFPSSEIGPDFASENSKDGQPVILKKTASSNPQSICFVFFLFFFNAESFPSSL